MRAVTWRQIIGVEIEMESDSDAAQLGRSSAACSSSVMRRTMRARQYATRRKKKQFQGRKERLRTQNIDLEKKVHGVLRVKCELEKKKSELIRENTHLRRLKA